MERLLRSVLTNKRCWLFLKKVGRLICLMKIEQETFSAQCEVLVFHMSNSRQHAVCSKERENKCQALLRLVRTVWNSRITSPSLTTSRSFPSEYQCPHLRSAAEGRLQTLKMSSSSGYLTIFYHVRLKKKKSNNFSLRR